jgi:hypothetical protein
MNWGDFMRRKSTGSKGKQFLTLLVEYRVLTEKEKFVWYLGEFWYRREDGWEVLSS